MSKLLHLYLVNNYGDEAGAGQGLTVHGAPARTSDGVIIAGREEAVEGREGLAKCGIAQVVTPAAELAEGGRIVTGQSLLIVPAHVGSRCGLDEPRHVHVVKALSRRSIVEPSEQVAQESADLTLHSTKLGPG